MFEKSKNHLFLILPEQTLKERGVNQNLFSLERTHEITRKELLIQLPRPKEDTFLSIVCHGHLYYFFDAVFLLALSFYSFVSGYSGSSSRGSSPDLLTALVLGQVTLLSLLSPPGGLLWIILGRSVPLEL